MPTTAARPSDAARTRPFRHAGVPTVVNRAAGPACMARMRPRRNSMTTTMTRKGSLGSALGGAVTRISTTDFAHEHAVTVTCA